MARPFSGNNEPTRSRLAKMKAVRRAASVRTPPGPNPVRVAQFAALTFIVGVTFLMIGYALS